MIILVFGVVFTHDHIGLGWCVYMIILVLGGVCTYDHIGTGWCSYMIILVLGGVGAKPPVFSLIRLDTAAPAHRSSVTISPAVTIATHHLARYLNI